MGRIHWTDLRNLSDLRVTAEWVHFTLALAYSDFYRSRLPLI